MRIKGDKIDKKANKACFKKRIGFGENKEDVLWKGRRSPQMSD